MIQLIDVLRGQAKPFGPGGLPSAIAKEGVPGRVAVGRLGITDDRHADQLHHGGPERALHHYAFDHYAEWRAEYPRQCTLFERPGFFGENLATLGMTEATVCVGDLYRIGTVLVQVSQPRQPCWKLAHRARVPELARRVQESGRAGWFYRVVEEGFLAEGAEVRLVERPRPEWTLARVLALLFSTPLARDGLATMASLAELSPGMRDLAARRLSSGAVESWERRLTIPCP